MKTKEELAKEARITAYLSSMDRMAFKPLRPGQTFEGFLAESVLRKGVEIGKAAMEERLKAAELALRFYMLNTGDGGRVARDYFSSQEEGGGE